jgi:hypothetical protein
LLQGRPVARRAAQHDFKLGLGLVEARQKIYSIREELEK